MLRLAGACRVTLRPLSLPTFWLALVGLNVPVELQTTTLKWMDYCGHGFRVSPVGNFAFDPHAPSNCH